MHPEDIEGQLAVVTGAARGIGRAIAERLAQGGARVIATDRDLPALEESFATTGVSIVELDVAVDAASQASALVNRFGAPQLIVNNVGITTPHRFLELSEADFDRVFETNLRGPWFFTKRLVESLIDADVPGSVLFVSSLHDHRVRLYPHYSSSKAAVRMLVRELAFELAPHRIRVNAISPGAVARDGRSSGDRVISRIPWGRAGAPADVASFAVTLLSDILSGYVTGANVPVDGGLDLFDWLMD